MNTLPIILGASLLVACTGKDARPAAPPESEPGFSAASGGDADVGPATETSVEDAVAVDTSGDATYADVPAGKDTAIDDVVELLEGGPRDEAPDTSVPDVLSFVDTALPGHGDAPPPGP